MWDFKKAHNLLNPPIFFFKCLFRAAPAAYRSSQAGVEWDIKGEGRNLSGQNVEKGKSKILEFPLWQPTRNHEVEGSIPGLAQWFKDPALP